MVAVVKELTQGRGPFIITYTGHQFHFLDPQPHDITLKDIAHALSQICRYTGHSRRFYSVAEHSVYVSALCENHLEGLFHDASEAYLSDISSPLKMLLPEYKKLQHSIEAAISKKFGIPFPFSENLKDVDTAQLKTEARNLLSDHSWVNNYPTKRKYGIIPACLPPKEAEELFIRTFGQLKNECFS
jgi:Predicted hydrolases of HD superfamily